MNLFVNEIFYSIQGETVTAGFPSLFVRVAGCNLNCRYCDTRYARDEGCTLPVSALIRFIDTRRFHHLTVTGGEPLLQDSVYELMEHCVMKGYPVQVETNGSRELAPFPDEVRKIVDVKTPSSGEEGSFLMENLNSLHQGDELKFVISDKEDYSFFRTFLEKYSTDVPSIISCSPAFGLLSPAELADWVLRDELQVRLNLQLHKMIWQGEEESKITIPLESIYD